jgi:predicted flap endonuclease-1-like 5' DNA nuclease
MASFSEIDFDKATADAQKAMHLPLGFMSPLWLAYSSMAGAGVAFWWMSQFAKPVNLEAMKDSWGKYSLVPMPEATLGEAPAVAKELVTQQMAAVDRAFDAVTSAMEPLIPEPAILAAAFEPEIEAAQVVMDTVPKVVEASADDLTKLSGIGPTLASKLSDLGVKTYADIASWTDGDIEKYDKTLKLLGRATRDKWIDQAKQFAEAGSTAY